MTSFIATVGAELTESEAALRVFLAAGGLVLLGLALLLLTISWWRGTRPEPPALGPLEVMGDRRWAAAAESERRRLLEEFRPVGAEPSNVFVEPEPVDLSVLAREAPPTFDDLREPSEDPEALEIAAESAVDDPVESVEQVESVEPVESVESVISSEVEIEVEIEVAPQAEIEIGPQVEVDVAPEVEVDVEPQAEVAVEPEVEVDVEPQAEVAVDGTVAMVVPEFEALPESSLMEPHVKGGHDGLDGHGGLDGRDETVAMMSPDRPVSPNAGL